ncbi:MAG TPA: peptidylprolyl isomerase [Bacteroidales bacterium]|jgi:FKBP-type peptidyl-prolyl cis-trans isomerase SlyD|nr:peptidylprolyl isomerase [Bacteroidales bacterium]
MTISKNKVVSLSYELRADNAEGEMIQTTADGGPLTFIFGSGMLLPDFEANIEGKAKGDLFSFGLTPEQAYGEKNPQAIIDVDIEIFKENGKLNESLVSLGNTIPMQDQEGHRLDGLVLEITDKVVKMDFNHPLAGQALHFSGEILELRDATEEELAHGHVHGPDGHHHH